MPREPRANWGHVHPALDPKPDPRFLLVPPAWFLGRTVKLAFPCVQYPQRREHCWVYVFAYQPDQSLLGVLDNDPVHNIGAAYGDTVQFTRDAIEAVHD